MTKHYDVMMEELKSWFLWFLFCDNYWYMTNWNSNRENKWIERWNQGAKVGSSIARVSCVLEQEIFLRPLSTKTTEFEVKVGAKIWKKQKIVLHW